VWKRVRQSMIHFERLTLEARNVNQATRHLSGSPVAALKILPHTTVHLKEHVDEITADVRRMQFATRDWASA
jgi:hypothetical protein